jgi:hypothetical protein
MWQIVSYLKLIIIISNKITESLGIIELIIIISKNIF